MKNRLTYANVMSTLAFVLATSTGTAYAANTIRSTDIVNGQVKAADLGSQSVTSTKIKSDSILGQHVGPDTLTGLEINESSLGRTPLSTSAVQGGSGRTTFGTGGSCDPESTVFIDCTTLGVNMLSSGRILLMGTIEALPEINASSMYGECRFWVNNQAVGLLPIYNGEKKLHIPINAVSQVVGPGYYVVRLQCNQRPEYGAINYKLARISLVTLSDW